FSTTLPRGTCQWQEGGRFIPGTVNTFGGSSTTEFGPLLKTPYPSVDSNGQPTVIERFNNFNSGDPGNPCKARLGHARATGIPLRVRDRARPPSHDPSRARSGDPRLGGVLPGLGRVALDDVAEHLVDALHDLGLERHAGGLDVLLHLLGARGAHERGGDVGVL